MLTEHMKVKAEALINGIKGPRDDIEIRIPGYDFWIISEKNLKDEYVPWDKIDDLFIVRKGI